jgi:chemotaxis protein CheY-P-specific phosphatase CheC
MYTIDWAITNYSTDAQNIIVSAYLQSGASFIGETTSSTTASSSVPAPVYNPGTGLITWTIPSIAAGTGIVDAPVSTSFTVSNTPAVNQVGSDITLLGATSLSATDAFTGGAFSVTTNPLTTALPDDKTLGTGLHQVTQ